MWLKTINDVAEQLYHLIRDYDVAYMVAELYVKKRVHDSTEEERYFYRTLRQSRKGKPEVPHFIHYNHNLFKGTIGYLSSSKGIRYPFWRVTAASWGVKKLDEEYLTLKDKLDDLNYIPGRVILAIIDQIYYDP